MVSIDFHNDIIGNALKMMLGLKSVAWERREGLAGQLASSCAIQTDDVTILGESACIIVLEDTLPEHSLFPNGNRGMPMALAHWRDKVSTVSDSRSLKAHAALVLRQIHDGRDYLQGPEPSLADINSAAWILETGLESDPTSPDMLTNWCGRMRKLQDHEGSDNFTPAFHENSEPINAVLHESGCEAGDLSISITGESDTLIYGKLADGNRIITSPLSHEIRL